MIRHEHVLIFFYDGVMSLLVLQSPLPPKMDFWGIRLPHEKKSTGGQALLRGIVQCFGVGFLWDTSKV